MAAKGIVAVLLIVLGMIGLQAQAIKYSVEAEDRNRAALLANELASAMWLSNSIAIDTSSGSPWATRAAGTLPMGTIEVAKELTLANSANITITWKPPQRNANEPEQSRLTTRVTLPPPT